MPGTLKIIGLFLLLLAPMSARAHICSSCQHMGDNCNFAGAFDGGTSSPQNCRDQQASPVCQKNCGPGGGGSEDSFSSSPFGAMGGSCQSNSDCFGLGSLMQNGGIGSLLGLNKTLNSEAAARHEAQARNIQQAREILGRWEKSLAPDDGKGRAQHQSDLQLVDKAEKSLKDKGEFPKDSVDNAKDGGIKRELGSFVANRDLESSIQTEVKKNEQAIKKIEAMNQKTESRKTNLDSIGGKGSADNRGKLTGLNGEGAAGEGTGAANGIGAGGLNAGAGGANSSGLTSGESNRLGTSLRDSIAKKLAGMKDGKDQKSNEALEGNKAFEGTLGMGGPNSEKLETKSQAEIISEMISTDKDKKFSLSGSDTDREVKRMLASAEAGKAENSGILSSDTLDLFTRVKNVHRSCEQRECVRLSRK